MSPGEVKGYLRQLSLRKGLTAEEKEAVKFALDALEVMVAVAPVVAKANKELEHVKNSDNAISVVDAGGVPEPNTGWTGYDVSPDREGPE